MLLFIHPAAVGAASGNPASEAAVAACQQPELSPVFIVLITTLGQHYCYETYLT